MRMLKKSFAATMVWGATMEGWVQQDCSNYDQGQSISNRDGSGDCAVAAAIIV
jgi:hypothetical protein